MSRRTTLPLGIDAGSVRTRVALAERDRAGEPRLIAVSARATGDDPSAAIAAACDELGTRERRCVLALSALDATVRTTALPPMSPGERMSAARFEAARFAPFPIDEAVLRVTVLSDRRCVVGVARRSALETRLRAAKRAGLRPVAVDHAAFALLRAFADADVLVDVGDLATTLIAADDPVPLTRTFATGGRAFAAAVSDALGIDAPAAQRRVRSVGLAGAGTYVRDALVDQLAQALTERRASARGDVRSIVLAGNGARLAGLCEALERAVAVQVRIASLAAYPSVIPADVVLAASPDWGLAYGLALWETAQ